MREFIKYILGPPTPGGHFFLWSVLITRAPESERENYWQREPLIIIKVEPSLFGCNSADRSTPQKFYFMSCCAVLPAATACFSAGLNNSQKEENSTVPKPYFSCWSTKKPFTACLPHTRQQLNSEGKTFSHFIFILFFRFRGWAGVEEERGWGQGQGRAEQKCWRKHTTTMERAEPSRKEKNDVEIK